MKNKNILLIVGVFTLAVVASVVLWLVFSKDNNKLTDKPNDSTTSQSEEQTNIEPIEPERVKPPENFDAGSIQEIPRETSFVYTDKIISPDTIASNPNDYLDKQITIRGWILEPTDNYFIVTSINSNEQKSLILAKNESIDFGEYANTSTDYTKSSKPVTLVGVILANDSNGNLEFIVESLNQ